MPRILLNLSPCPLMFFLKPVNKVQISADDHGSVSDQPFIII
jgi:hypothetical protein